MKNIEKVYQKIFVLTFIYLTAFNSLSSAQDTVYLRSKDMRPMLIIYRPDSKYIKNAGVIICSGGSYSRTNNEREGMPVARIMASNGITAFVLDYRLPEGRDSLSLADAQKSIRYVREHAKHFHINENRVGILGFSAGGHLVSTIGTHWKNNYDGATSTTSARPDFMVLVYPVISFADSLTHLDSRHNFLGTFITSENIFEFSNELQVTGRTPPTFIVHAVDDETVKIANSLYFEAALRQHHVPVEMFLYAKGGHGFGINNEAASVQWTEPCIKWIRNQRGVK